MVGPFEQEWLVAVQPNQQCQYTFGFTSGVAVLKNRELKKEY